MTVIPADPVKVVRSYLLDKYPWPVTITKNRPNLTGRHVTIRRSGGVGIQAKVVDPAWLTVECFAENDEQAADLAHLTWGLLFGMEGAQANGVQIYRVSAIAAPNDFPLAAAGEMQRPRFTMTVQVQTRAASA